MAKIEQSSVEIDKKYQEEVEEALRKEGELKKEESKPENVLKFLKEKVSGAGEKIEKYWGKITNYFKRSVEGEVRELQEEGLDGIERIEKAVAESAESGIDTDEEIIELTEDMIVVDEEAEEAKKDIDNLIDELSAGLEQDYEKKQKADKDFAEWARERAKKSGEKIETFGGLHDMVVEKLSKELKDELRRKESRLKKAETELAKSSNKDKKLLEFKIDILGRQVSGIKRDLEGAEEAGTFVDFEKESEKFEKGFKERTTPKKAEKLTKKETRSIEDDIKDKCEEGELSFKWEKYLKEKEKDSKKLLEFQQEYLDKFGVNVAKPRSHETEKSTKARASVLGE